MTPTAAVPRGTTGMEGCRALVVGGYGGIGRAVAASLTREGASVAVAGRSLDTAVECAEGLGNGSRTTGHQVDVTDPAGVRSLLADVVGAWGGIDILVNCASALVVRGAEDFDEADWREIVDTNLSGAFWLSQAAGRHMIQAGQGGRIIHLSSVRGSAGASRGFTAYGASKSGVNLLVKQLATEWGKHGITVNAVAPGFVRTEFVEQSSQDDGFLRMITARTPLGRTADVQEVADAVIFLASPGAGFITGQILFVDGGVSASQ